MIGSGPRRYVRTRYLPVPVGARRWYVVDRLQNERYLTVGEGSPEPLEFTSRGDAQAFLRDAGMACQLYVAFDSAY